MQELRDHKVYLDGVAPVRINAIGNHFYILEATAPVHLNFDNRNQITRKKGQGGDVGQGFREVILSSDAPQTVVVALGHGRVRETGLATFSGDLSATIENANQNQGLPEVTVPAGQVAQICAANVNRKEVRLSIKSDAAGGVYLGHSALPAGQGGYLDVGMVDYMSTQGALYARNENGQAVTVQTMELNRA